TVTGAPNQMFSVAGLLSLIINEQINTSSGMHNEITTNALHLTLNAALVNGDIVVGHANSDVTFAPAGGGGGTQTPEPGTLAMLSGCFVPVATGIYRKVMRRK